MEKECIAHVSSKTLQNSSPGPAYYNISDESLHRPPPIIFRGRRSQQQGDINTAPYYNLKSTFGNAPSATLHGRPEIKSKDYTPGPTYVPPLFGSNCRTHSFASPSVAAGKQNFPVPKGKPADYIHKSRNLDATPGPGPAYCVRDKSFDATGNQGVKISGHHDFQYLINSSPGPGTYKPHYDAVLPSAPKYGFHNRPVQKVQVSTAGYRNLGSTLGQGPKFTMKARATDEINLH